MSHFGLCSLVVGYCIMGAFLFEFLEASNERNKRQEMMRWRSGLAEVITLFADNSRAFEMVKLLAASWCGLVASGP